MLTEKELQVLERIETAGDRIAATLQRLVAYRTITPGEGQRAAGGDYAALQADVGGRLEALGMQVDVWEADAAALPSFPGSGVQPHRDLSGMPVLNATLPGSGGGPSLLLNAHYDVVPVGEQEAWSCDPFAGKIKDGRLYGRGAADMKAGLAAMLEAAAMLREAGVRLKGDLLLQSVPDEEASCMGTLAACARGYRADAAVIPEPTGMQILIAQRGSTYGTITVYGRAGHAEMTQPHWRDGGAVNAITKAAKVISGLDALNQEWRDHPSKQHKYLDPDTFFITGVRAGVWGVSYPDTVELSYGSTSVPGSGDKEAEIREKLAAVAAADDWMRHHPPTMTAHSWYAAEVAEDEPIVQEMSRAAESLGYPARLRGFGSLTDAIHLINFAKIPTVCFGPDMANLHGADESVSLRQLVDMAKALALMAMRWCGVAD